MKNRRIIAKPGFIIFVLSIAGFVYATTLKKQKQVFYKKFYNTDINEGKLQVKMNEKYTFAFSTLDEESEGFAQWPLAEACLVISNHEGTQLVNDTIAHGGFENVGVKRALAIEEYTINTDFEGELSFKCKLIEGMECELIIYKNIEDWRNMLPALFILSFIVGLFLFLRKKQN